MEYEKHFQNILNFLELHRQLIDCHLVDFITEQLWEKCLSEQLRLELEQINMNIDLRNSSNIELNNFIEATKNLTLETCPAIIDIDEVLNLKESDKKLKNMFSSSTALFMNEKKSYEVEVLGKVVAEIAKSSHSLVIDAGAGKAYLSTYLSENYDIPVLAIDSSISCHKSATNRQEKLKKRNKMSCVQVQYVVEEINDTTDYIKMVKVNFPNWNLNQNLLLTGLHTCGSLIHSAIKVFLRTKDIQCLCIVPCCYHLVTESLSKKCYLSKNARMLAQQCIERTCGNNSFCPSLFYRAVLQTILHSLGLYNAKVGRGGPLQSFPAYAHWALSKVGVEPHKIPSFDRLEEIFQKHINWKKKLHLFQKLRIHLSQVIEAAIMLDRIIFLLNSNLCSHVGVLRLFDPVLSPRCYALIAMK